VTVKPSWSEGNGSAPNAGSTLAFSITTSKPGSLASDDARWFWSAGGVVPHGTPAYIEKSKDISTSPTHNYISIQSGATLGNLIALYALNAHDLYKGGLDKFMIDAGRRPGYGEVIFAEQTYMNAMGDDKEGSFRGALWRQEVLEHPDVNTDFIYTGEGVDALLVPDSDAKMWYEK